MGNSDSHAVFNSSDVNYVLEFSGILALWTWWRNYCLHLRVYSLGMTPIWMNNAKSLRSCCIKRITSSTYWFLSWDAIAVILDHWFWSVSFQRKIFFNSHNANASFINLFPGMEMIVGKAGKRDIQSEYSFQILLNIGDIKLDTVYKCISLRLWYGHVVSAQQISCFDSWQLIIITWISNIKELPINSKGCLLSDLYF